MPAYASVCAVKDTRLATASISRNGIFAMWRLIVVTVLYTPYYGFPNIDNIKFSSKTIPKIPSRHIIVAVITAETLRVVIAVINIVIIKRIPKTIGMSCAIEVEIGVDVVGGVVVVIPVVVVVEVVEVVVVVPPVVVNVKSPPYVSVTPSLTIAWK